MILRQFYGVIVRHPFTTFFGYGYDLLSAEGAVVVAEIHSLQLDDLLDVAFEIAWARNGSHICQGTRKRRGEI